MNEQLQGKLVEILSVIQTATKAAGDFAMEQLPDIAQSYVMYGRISSVVLMLLGMCLLYLSFRLFRAGIESDSYSVIEIFGPIGGSLSAVAGGLLTVINAQQAILVWVAPKVWLLKELAGILK
jgi:hypothetical protein